MVLHPFRCFSVVSLAGRLAGRLSILHCFLRIGTWTKHAHSATSDFNEFSAPVNVSFIGGCRYTTCLLSRFVFSFQAFQQGSLIVFQVSRATKTATGHTRPSRRLITHVKLFKSKTCLGLSLNMF